MNKYFCAVGRRKTAIARARVFGGSGKIIVNGAEIKDLKLNEKLGLPFAVVASQNKFDATVKIRGGGSSSWIGATQLALSRALFKINPEFEKVLRSEGLLTRDPREKERKKPGLKRARRAPQWQKR